MIYRWIHHKRTMDRLAQMLSERGCTTDVVCLHEYEFTQNTRMYFVALLLRLVVFLKNSKNPRIKRYAEKYIPYILHDKLLIHYDKIVFHAYYSDYNPWMEKCEQHQIKYDIVLWGSDVLRSSDENFQNLEWGFEHCNKICGLEPLTNKLTEKYFGRFRNKYINTLFGNSNLKVIDSVAVDEEKKAELFGEESKGKLIVTCGYNGLPAQQHYIMFEAIKSLPNDIKKNIHIVVPMTYEGQSDYIDKSEEFLNNSGVTYKIIKRFLSPEELGLLRKASDIVLNTQTTDAFCSAIQEHIYCGCVVLIADWLYYPLLDRENVWYIKFNNDTLEHLLKETIIHFEDYKKKTLLNAEKIKDIVPWGKVINNWITAFNS